MGTTLFACFWSLGSHNRYFAPVVGAAVDGVSDVELQVLQVDVPELQSADLSDAQPAHQQREMDRQAVVFREAFDQRVDLLPGHRRLLASLDVSSS